MLALQPKTIAREFVRQYYTILSKSPVNLYCFYYEDSVFDHDNMQNDEKNIPAIGKAAISEVMKCYTKNYENCCTIVSSIETTSTLNNGLVIQVYGEISTNIDQMRPFCQTFVLAAASPLKYYIHNDIFRYQDSRISQTITAESEIITKHLTNNRKSIVSIDTESMVVASENNTVEPVRDDKAKIIECHTLEVGQLVNSKQLDDNNNEICNSVADFMALARISAENKENKDNSINIKAAEENIVNNESDPIIIIEEQNNEMNSADNNLKPSENEKKTYADFLKLKNNENSDSDGSITQLDKSNLISSFSGSKIKRKGNIRTNVKVKVQDNRRQSVQKEHHQATNNGRLKVNS